jgi:hypothetical protein
MAKDCVAEWLQVFDFKSAPGKTRTCGLLIRSQSRALLRPTRESSAFLPDPHI